MFAAMRRASLPARFHIITNVILAGQSEQVSGGLGRASRWLNHWRCLALFKSLLLPPPLAFLLGRKLLLCKPKVKA
jgi:hypothetical protein